MRYYSTCILISKVHIQLNITFIFGNQFSNCGDQKNIFEIIYCFYRKIRSDTFIEKKLCRLLITLSVIVLL